MMGRIGIQTRLKHSYSYPRCPKINGYVKRANRTLQEEFVNLKNLKEDVILDSLNEFNKELIDYHIWYNTKRVHKGLNNQTPMDYIIKNYPTGVPYVWNLYRTKKHYPTTYRYLTIKKVGKLECFLDHYLGAKRRERKKVLGMEEIQS